LSNLSIGFMMVAIAAALIGMCGGAIMAIEQDVSLAPAHAHLNLLGWVTMALYRLFYRAFPDAAHGVLPGIHFWSATCGVTLMVPGIAWTVLRHDGGERIIASGALMVICGMVVFGIVVVRAHAPARQQRVAATL